ncbi:YozQ family protein [Halobacillus sp. B29]|uniref:YozQ family protein n=1 Tax=Halobacillus sp. B29 TaxID=3457432 RepID=UPI003FCE82DA
MSKKQKIEQIAERSYESADYEKNDETSRGLSVTHEQVSDTMTEGTIDGNIDQLDKDGNVISHEGKPLSRERFPKYKK